RVPVAMGSHAACARRSRPGPSRSNGARDGHAGRRTRVTSTAMGRPETRGQPPQRGTGRAAALVAAGILASRLLGVVRQSLMARYLGATSGIAADAFMAAFKIPNLLQNLFVEGALSASFIPVYSNLLARDEREEARRVAGALA